MRRGRRAVAGLSAGGLLLALAAPGCGDKTTDTGLVLKISTDLTADKWTKFDVQVDGGKAHYVWERSGVASVFELAVAPEGNPNRGVELTVAALNGDTVVVSQTATTTFQEGKQEEVSFFLSRDCVSAPSCGQGMSCAAGGKCVGSDVLGTKYPRGMSPDAGSPTDAGAGDRPPDMSTPDAGPDGPPREVGSVTGSWMLSEMVPATTLTSVFAVSEREVWAVGYMTATGLAYRYDGQMWAAETLPLTGILRAVWASGSGDVWAAGERGNVLRRVGGTWRRERGGAGGMPGLNGIWGSGPNDVWFVGDGSTVLRWDGTNLVSASSGVSSDLSAINGTSLQNLWAVGAQGGIYRWNQAGSAWTKQEQTFTSGVLYSVWTTAANDVWAVGQSGVALHNDGSGWKGYTTGLASAVGVYAAADNQVWAVGRAMLTQSSAIAHFNGATWTTVPVPMTKPLQAIHGRGPNEIWAVGGDMIGVILQYK